VQAYLGFLESKVFCYTKEISSLQTRISGIAQENLYLKHQLGIEDTGGIYPMNANMGSSASASTLALAISPADDAVVDLANGIKHLDRVFLLLFIFF
jgi:hypothetical protein